MAEHECTEPYRECVRNRQARVFRVIEANPAAPARHIAELAGVSDYAVRLYKKKMEIAISTKNTVKPDDAKVVGIDGKKYPMKLPFKDQPEVKRFMKALLNLSWEQKLYLWQYILPRYHPRGLQNDVKETGHGEQASVS